MILADKNLFQIVNSPAGSDTSWTMWLITFCYLSTLDTFYGHSCYDIT